MCGIAGAVSADRPLRAEVLIPALNAISHRGPDGEGSWSDGICALGQRRLAILDLSDSAQAPLSNEDGTVWVTFNGEIYNFRDLRAELEKKGHRFRSTGDTEVIVHAYEEWGPGCLDRFRGMFALAVWDLRARQLLLARDRVGKKPLFYAPAGLSLYFASEIQALLAMPAVDPGEPDPEAIDRYLSWGYVPAPATGFTGIKKIPPGHYAIVDLRDGLRTTVTSYWDLRFEPKAALSESEAIDALRLQLTKAVELRMISDVPVGAFLSGGIDSSIVVGLMAQLSPVPVRTFSIGFDEASYDELEHARRIADLWGTDHEEHVVRPDALDVLPSLLRHYGEPFADSSAIPTYYVSKITSGSVKVALAGDGGDESFAGYERYRAHRVAATLSRLPMRRAIGGMAALLPDSGDPKNRLRRVRRFLKVAGKSPIERYGRWMSYFDPTAKSTIYSTDFSSAVWPLERDDWFASLFTPTNGLSPEEQAMSVDIQSYLPFDLLTKVDIASMANSLEVRAPFLDQEVMELAATLPAHFKLSGGVSKQILRATFPDLLPEENLRRPKMGFGVPVGRWFRGPLRELLVDSVLSKRSMDRGYFERPAIERLVNDHLSGAADHSSQLWGLVMLELWHREVVEGRSVATHATGAS